MTGGRAQHLQRRSGVWHLRVRVPDDIRSLVGLTEVRRSLRTYEPARARVLAAVYSARVFEVFGMVRTKTLSKEQVRSLICNLFEQISREAEEHASSRLDDWERNELLYSSSEFALAVREQRDQGAYDGTVRMIAEQALAPLNIRAADLDAIAKDDLLEGAARPLVERERLFQLRMSDRLSVSTIHLVQRAAERGCHRWRCISCSDKNDMTDQGTTICTKVPRAEQIARLNDQLRKTGTGGTVVITQGVKHITSFDADAISNQLANYSDFDPDNDPHGERDFGCLTLWGHDLLWKVDYYDKDLQFGSDDPANPEVTHRVHTVLLASEW